MIGKWGNFASNPLTEAEQQQNAREIWGYFNSRGWTLESVSGMLGNMQFESYINPAQWEASYPIYSGGFGLVQWTPYTNYSNWAGDGWETDYNRQLERIQWELENGAQWQPVARFDYMSFEDYTQSTETPEYLAEVFEYSYERGTWSDYRKQYARAWYDYLGGVGPASQLPIWMLFLLRRRNYGYTYSF